MFISAVFQAVHKLTFDKGKVLVHAITAYRGLQTQIRSFLISELDGGQQ
jgi:hypothetical protein